MTLAFDLTAERARFEARQPFLAQHWAMAVDLAPGLRFQPETEASVADQVRETFWSEGNDPDVASPAEVEEMRASFDALAPRRESDGWSVVATLMLGFADATRDAELARLTDLPDALCLVLDDGREVPPAVDLGHTGGSDRLPAVLALRYAIPDGHGPVALAVQHPALAGVFPAPPAWRAWLPAGAQWD